MAPRCVHIDRHVGLLAGQRAGPRDGADILAELGAVERVAEGQERGKKGDGGGVEAGEVGEVAGLMDLVDVGFFRGEVQVFEDLGAYGA